MLYSLSREIEYVPAGENPLSAEVFIIKTAGSAYIYDVGASDEALEAVNKIASPKNIIISHFHEDHMGNVKRMLLQSEDRIFGGDFTGKKVPEAVVVRGKLTLEPGVDIFPVPSSHSKGCLGMRCGEMAFLGDSTYACRINGETAYNVSILHETIRVLENLEVETFVLSHRLPKVRNKEELLKELKEIYKQRRPGEAYIT